MALTKAQKQELVGRYEGGLATAPHAFLISYQGIKVNDVTVSDERMVLSRAQLGSQGAIKLSFGRKKHVLIQER